MSQTYPVYLSGPSNGFDFLTDTEIMLDGNRHRVRFENGMTGIGSRLIWVDGKELHDRCVRQSGNLCEGNHFIYRMKWRETPWDWVLVIISEEQLPLLLSEENKWRQPSKVEI